MPLERLTMLVLRPDGEPVLVVPALEAPRVSGADDLLSMLPWTDDQDPIELVASLLTGGPPAAGRPLRLAVSDRAWATPVLSLQPHPPRAEWRKPPPAPPPTRAIKASFELEALRAAGAAADRVATRLQAGGI